MFIYCCIYYYIYIKVRNASQYTYVNKYKRDSLHKSVFNKVIVLEGTAFIFFHDVSKIDFSVWLLRLSLFLLFLSLFFFSLFLIFVVSYLFIVVFCYNFLDDVFMHLIYCSYKARFLTLEFLYVYILHVRNWHYTTILSDGATFLKGRCTKMQAELKGVAIGGQIGALPWDPDPPRGPGCAGLTK